MPGIASLLAAAFAAGVFAAGFYKGEPLVLLGLACALACLALWRICRSRPGVVPVMAAIFLLAGMIRAGHADMLSPLDVSRYAGRPATVYGTVAELPQVWAVDRETVNVKYIVAVEAVAGDKPGLNAADGSVAVNIRQPRTAAVAACGDRITAGGRLRAVEGYKNPGRIDSAAASRLQGVTARLTAQAGDCRFSPAGGRSWPAAVAGWRSAVTRAAARSMAAGDAAILNGILFGGYNGIKQEVVRDFAATGIVHILSVSGTHIALVAGVVLWLAARFGLRRGRASALAAAAIVFYAAFAGLAPPVVRSLVMGLAALAAAGLGRQKDAGQALALAALAMLAYQPALLYDIS